MNKKIQLLFILFFSYVYGSSQETTKVIPPSPDAANLGRYGEYPVNQYSGQAAINLPLYTIESGDLKLPISLSYNSSGNRVGDIASWIGLGWTLNAGGVITRTVRGNADEGIYGYFSSTDIPTTLFQDEDINIDEDINFLEKVGGGTIDTEPDLFFFNFNGYTGRFIFDKDRNVRMLPYQDINITPDSDLSSWIVTTPDGISYYFGDATTLSGVEVVSGSSLTYYNEQTTPHREIVNGKNSSWYLKKIISPSGQTIILNYLPTYYKYRGQDQEQRILYGESNTISFKTKSYTEFTVAGFRLASIDFQGGTIYFNVGDQRDDIDPSSRSNQNFPRVLDNITIKDYNDHIKKKIKLNTSYFKTYNSSIKYSEKRLRLDDIQVVNPKNEADKELLYRFSYNNEKLPDRFSYSQDHWGYYNGKTNSTLIPDYNDIFNDVICISATLSGDKYREVIESTHPIYFNGANRKPSSDKMKACILKEIYYPTGGHTQFNYEPHTYCIFNEQDKPLYYENEVINQIIEFNTKTIYDGDDIGKGELFADVTEKTFTYEGETFCTAKITGLYPSKLTSGCDLGSNRRHVFKIVDITAQNVEYMYSSDNSTEDITIDDRIVLVPDHEYKIVMERWCGAAPIKIGITGEYIVEKTDETGAEVSEFTAGGLRIESVNNYTTEGISSSKIYSYVLSSNGRSYSSGVMSSIPIYHQYGRLSLDHAYYTVWGSVRNTLNLNLGCLILQSGCFFNLGSVNGGKIGYRSIDVTDRVYKNGEWIDNGKTQYKYTSVLDYPDKSSHIGGDLLARCDFTDRILVKYNNSDNVSPTQLLYPYAPQTNYEWKRGLLKAITSYDKNNSKVKKIEFNYNLVTEEDKRNEIVGLYLRKKITTMVGSSNYVGYDYNKYTILSGWNHKIQKREVLYDGDSIITTTNYEYESPNNGFLTKETNISSSEDQIDTYYYYPHDFSQSNSIMNKMVKNYIISPIVKKEGYVGNSRLYGIKYDYRLENSVVVKDCVRKWDSEDDYYEDIRFDKYNSIGSILQFHSINNNNTCYLWGYNKQYPIAKIENLSYTEVVNSGVKTNFDKLEDYTIITDSNRSSLNTVNDNIRNNLPDNVLVTTYTYDPLIGMTSQTDPNGRTTYYEYDDFGRLKLVRDNDGNILQRYDYNYAH